MEAATFELLEKLHGQHGPREFGKMCQKFLAISYRLAGFQHIEERGVQGVDLDAASDSEKYTTEVKTTIRDSIHFQKKDAEGLLKRTADGYQPLLAVLRLGPFSEWFLVHADRLKPGLLLIDMLRPYRYKELEDRLGPLFDAAVRTHGAGRCGKPRSTWTTCCVRCSIVFAGERRGVSPPWPASVAASLTAGRPMICRICKQPASGQCQECRRFYCPRHGDIRCVACEETAQTVQSIQTQRRESSIQQAREEASRSDSEEPLQCFCEALAFMVCERCSRFICRNHQCKSYFFAGHCTECLREEKRAMVAFAVLLATAPLWFPLFVLFIACIGWLISGEVRVP